MDKLYYIGPLIPFLIGIGIFILLWISNERGYRRRMRQLCEDRCAHHRESLRSHAKYVKLSACNLYLK